jgi:hypothetical protein
LEAADETAAEGDTRQGRVPAFPQRVDFHCAVHGADDALAVDEPAVEIEALDAGEGFDLHAWDGREDEADAVEGVVDAERAFLVAAQQDATSELLVKVPQRHVHAPLRVRPAREAVAYAGAAVPAWKPDDRPEVGFETQACREVARGGDDVAEGVQPGFRRRDDGADAVVLGIGLPKQLRVAADGQGRWAVLSLGLQAARAEGGAGHSPQHMPPHLPVSLRNCARTSFSSPGA